MQKSDQIPSGVKESVYETEKMTAILGGPTFIVDAAQAFIQAKQELAELEKEQVAIYYNDWFKNAATVDVETDEEMGRIIKFKTANPTKENLVGTWQFEKLQQQFYSDHMTLIKALHSEIKTMMEERNRKLASSILEERVYQCDKICKALVGNTSIDEILKNPIFSSSFRELKRKGNEYSNITEISSIAERRFIVVDNIHSISENENMDEYIGKGKTSLIHSSFKMFKECFRNPTEKIIKGCAEMVIQIEGNTDNPGFQLGRPMMYA